jgi:CheY-like chemotaxis protein
MSKIVLIVDDEDMIHELLTIHFQRLKTPIEVFNARTGLEAIAMYRSLMESDRTPDLVVMDLNLAGEENIEVIERHKAGGKPLDGVRTTRELLKLDPTVRIWGYTAWFETDWSKDLGQYADRIVERTIPFHEFAEMVDRFFQAH